MNRTLWLRAALGENLVVFGFAFHQGSFQAIKLPYAGGGLHTFQAEAAPEDSIGAVFASAGSPLAAMR